MVGKVGTNIDEKNFSEKILFDDQCMGKKTKIEKSRFLSKIPILAIFDLQSITAPEGFVESKNKKYTFPTF